VAAIFCGVSQECVLFYTKITIIDHELSEAVSRMGPKRPCPYVAVMTAGRSVAVFGSSTHLLRDEELFSVSGCQVFLTHFIDICSAD